MVDVRMGAPSGRGGRGGSGDTTRPEKSPVGKVWTSKAIQELLKQHEQDAAKASKPPKFSSGTRNLIATPIETKTKKIAHSERLG